MGQSAAKAVAKNLIIYAVINTVNGKRYIGQSRQGLARRKGEHIYRFNLGERDHKLYQAMREYGIQNFKFEVLCHCPKPEDLDEMEVHFMALFDTVDNGYNMTWRGETSDETKAKLSAKFKGRKAPWAEGGRITEARRRNGTLYGTSMPKGAKSKLAVSYLVRCPDGSEIKVRGLRQFCRDRSLSHNLMFAVLAGKQHHHKGYALLARFND